MSSTEQLAILPATKEPFQIVYADDVLLVVNKPARLLTVPGRHPQNQDCLIRRVQRNFLLQRLCTGLITIRPVWLFFP